MAKMIEDVTVRVNLKKDGSYLRFERYVEQMVRWRKIGFIVECALAVLLSAIIYLQLT